MADPGDQPVRLNRFLASCGAVSRRGSEELIRQGRVEINGKTVRDLATRVHPGDHVKLDGKLLQAPEPLTVALNKPKGYLCTRRDPEGRPTVYDLLPRTFGTLNYIGRLDIDSQGLLLFSSSGDLVEKLTHPRFHVEKEYVVRLDRPFNAALTAQLLEGVRFAEGVARADSVSFDSRRLLRIVLSQGFNRQIRRMLAKLGYKVKSLERVRIGTLSFPGLSTGEHRVLGRPEIEAACTNPR